MPSEFLDEFSKYYTHCELGFFIYRTQCHHICAYIRISLDILNGIVPLGLHCCSQDNCVVFEPITTAVTWLQVAAHYCYFVSRDFLLLLNNSFSVSYLSSLGNLKIVYKKLPNS